MTDLIRVEKRDRIVLLTIDRPDKKNALMDKMYRALAAEIRKADADDEVRALVLTGVADSFTAGNDMVDFLNQKGTFETTGAHEFMLALYDFRKPALAAVNGMAIGVGVTLLLHCDISYAAESATFRMPFVSIGIAPEFHSSYLLPMMMGHARASELLLTGEKFDARKAHECGIVNAVVPDAEVLSRTMAKARQLAEQPPATLRACKKLLRDAVREPAMAAFNREIVQLNAMIRNNPEATEAMTAFMQKRKPDFSKFK
ncbi:MAG TPA: enoyl-CoA hydratase [Verrucomicrobiae bacterium]|nr:enoyl-CoA hydratase [Verrucomicrobiae bacterium]